MGPPKEVMTLASQPKKQHTKPSIVRVHEEISGTCTVEPSQTNFLKGYIPPRKLSTKPVNLQKEVKYDLLEPKVLPGVITEGDMLGAIPSLKFIYHNLLKKKKFLDLSQRKYMNTFIDPEMSFIRVEPKTWKIGLEKSRILSLLQIPHFVKLHPWHMSMVG
jgi:hypothetical protein